LPPRRFGNRAAVIEGETRVTESDLPAGEDEPEPLCCTTCDRRAAKPVDGPPFCLKCIHDGEITDPYLNWCARQVLGVS
jgi:hypothetical protein